MLLIAKDLSTFKWALVEVIHRLIQSSFEEATEGEAAREAITVGLGVRNEVVSVVFLKEF